MKSEILGNLPDWPALMDTKIAELYLGGSETTLAMLEAEGLLPRFSNGHKNVRYLRVHIDGALLAKTMLKKPKTKVSAPIA